MSPNFTLLCLAVAIFHSSAQNLVWRTIHFYSNRYQPMRYCNGLKKMENKENGGDRGPMECFSISFISYWPAFWSMIWKISLTSSSITIIFHNPNFYFSKFFFRSLVISLSQHYSGFVLRISSQIWVSTLGISSYSLVFIFSGLCSLDYFYFFWIHVSSCLLFFSLSRCGISSNVWRFVVVCFYLARMDGWMEQERRWKLQLVEFTPE